MATNRTYTIVERSRGIRSEFTGTIEELVQRFEGILRAGNFYDRKVKRTPRDIRVLITSLNTASEKLFMGGNYQLSAIA